MIHIVEFAAHASVISGLAIIFAALVQKRISQGYNTAPDGSIIGKNAATGQDSPDSQTTQQWDTPKYTNIGTWGVYTFPADIEGDVLPELIADIGPNNIAWRMGNQTNDIFTLNTSRRFSPRFSSRFN